MQVDEDLMSIPVIVLTVDQEAELDCLKIGAMNFIPKPYPDIEIVKARIPKCIELSEDRELIRYTERDKLTSVHHRAGGLRPGTGPYRTAEEAQALQRLHHLLHQNPLRVLRGVVRLKGLAQHRPLPQGDLALQRQVRQQGASMLHAASDRGGNQGGVHPGGEQAG